MWRLWTRGWGPRDWWYWFTNEGFPMFVAWRIPHRIALWTFIRVYAKDGLSPGPEFDRVCRAWDARSSFNETPDVDGQLGPTTR